MAYPVTAVPLPSPSLVERALSPCDYVDAFAVRAPPATFRSVDALARASTDLPRWVGLLMALRNRIVSAFGLKTEPDERGRRARDGAAIVPGSAVGIFLVMARSADEILMGLDDKHLDFRFALTLQTDAEGERAVATTTVRFHNVWGRAYFAIVKPFHRRIVPAMLRAALARREREIANG